jgi:hypothetical protein
LGFFIVKKLIAKKTAKNTKNMLGMWGVLFYTVAKIQGGIVGKGRKCWVFINVSRD